MQNSWSCNSCGASFSNYQEYHFHACAGPTLRNQLQDRLSQSGLVGQCPECNGALGGISHALGCPYTKSPAVESVLKEVKPRASVSPIGEKGKTPQLILNELIEDIHNVDDIFVITFTKDGGAGKYFCGDVSSMALASVMLQDSVSSALRKASKI